MRDSSGEKHLGFYSWRIDTPPKEIDRAREIGAAGTVSCLADLQVGDAVRKINGAFLNGLFMPKQGPSAKPVFQAMAETLFRDEPQSVAEWAERAGEGAAVSKIEIVQ